MGLFDRLSDSVRSAIDGVSDPDEELDYTYEQMKEELDEVKEGISDLATERKRLENHRDELRAEVDEHNEQARKAVQKGRDDLAERALKKKKTKMQQIDNLDDRVEELRAAQRDLVDKRDTLEQRVQEFRTRKETLKARRKAAGRTAEANEAVAGNRDRMGEVDRAVEKVETDTETMEARAAALDELESEGVFDDGVGGDSIDRQLEQLDTDETVENELDTLRRQVGTNGESSGDEDEDETN